MRQRQCNSCKIWSEVYKWIQGCPKCGHTNGRDISYNVHEVMPDIKPYKSMVDGSEITSRSKHTLHLKKHHCQEVGNEISALMKRGSSDVDPKGRKELIVAQIQALGHEGFKKAIKKDVDFIKWNSRNLPKEQ